MSTMRTVLSTTCLALATFCATAQTAGAPPTHPATGSSDAASSASPTTAPTHPAAGTSGATPAAAAGAQNPSVNGYKESTPAAGDAKRANARATSKPAPEGGTGGRNPTSTDSMAKDNMPKHPAADGQTK
jgi:hypothetical protein